MNAGAYGAEIKDVFVAARAVSRDGAFHEYCGHEHSDEYGPYRIDIRRFSDPYVFGGYR